MCGLRACPPEARHLRIALGGAQIDQRLLSDDPVGHERPTTLKGDHPGAEVVVEELAIPFSSGNAVELGELLSHPLHVLAARAQPDGNRDQLGRLPEENERTIPVEVGLAQRENVPPPPEVEGRVLLVQGHYRGVPTISRRRRQLDDGREVEPPELAPRACLEETLKSFGATALAAEVVHGAVDVKAPARIEAGEGRLPVDA